PRQSRGPREVEGYLPHKLVHHFFTLLINRNRERHERSRIRRHGNPLNSRCGWSEAVPTSFFRNKIHKKQLPIDFKSQFVSSFLVTNYVMQIGGARCASSASVPQVRARSFGANLGSSPLTSCLRRPRTRRRS